MSQIQVNKIYGANVTNAPAFPKGVSKALFPHLLVSSNNVTIAGGYMFLDDGRELATWDGVNYGVEFQMNLKTEVNNTGVSLPAANTTYYLYVYLNVIGGVVLTPIGRAVHAAQKGASGAWIVLATAPEDTDTALYVYVGVLRTDSSADYTMFETGPESQYSLGSGGATLQSGYLSGNTITTAPSPGHVIIAGTEALQITAAGGLLMNQASTTNEGIDLTMTSATIAPGLLITQAGTGTGATVSITNAANTTHAALFSTVGSGNGIRASSLLGGAANFINGGSSTSPVITVQNGGTGSDLATINDTVTDNLWFKTGNASAGDSGDFLFETGTATGVRGSVEIQALSFLRGSTVSETVEEQYFHLETLTASSINTAVPDFQFAHAAYEGLKIDYKIKEATSNAIRVGSLYIGTNGTVATLSDFFTENANVGVTWSVAVVGANVEVRYTTTANNKIMRADVKRIRT